MYTLQSAMEEELLIVHLTESHGRGTVECTPYRAPWESAVQGGERWDLVDAELFQYPTAIVFRIL